MEGYCPKCGTRLIPGAKFCSRCGEDISEQNMKPIFSPQQNPQPVQPQHINPNPNQPTPPNPQPPAPLTGQPGTQQSWKPELWYQNFYRIRKKVVTVGNKYWLEDQNSAIIGFCKQKLFKLKEDIRIYTNETMEEELFRIKQEQITDAWGNFAVIDSASNQKIGFVKRNILSAFVKDSWEIYTTSGQLVGKIEEKSTGHALARKYMPGGGLIPEKMHITMNNQPIADVSQEFKIVGDIWTMNCYMVPDNFDRRVLLACILLMGMIERSHK